MSPKQIKKDLKDEKTIEQAKSSKSQKEKKAKAKKPKEQPVDLPLLVEVGFSFSIIFLMLVDALVAYVSFVSGASWIDIFMRVVISTITVGFILWLFTMNLSNGSLSAALKHIEEEEEKERKEEEQEVEESISAKSPSEQLGAEA